MCLDCAVIRIYVFNPLAMLHINTEKCSKFELDLKCLIYVINLI